MELKITCRHMKDSEKVRTYAEEKLSKLDRFYNALHEAEVILKEEDRQCNCEVILHIRNLESEFVKVSCDSMIGAIDMSVDKAEKLLRRMKEKRESRRRPAVQ